MWADYKQYKSDDFNFNFNDYKISVDGVASYQYAGQFSTTGDNPATVTVR